MKETSWQLNLSDFCKFKRETGETALSRRNNKNKTKPQQPKIGVDGVGFVPSIVGEKLRMSGRRTIHKTHEVLTLKQRNSLGQPNRVIIGIELDGDNVRDVREEQTGRQKQWWKSWPSDKRNGSGEKRKKD